MRGFMKMWLSLLCIFVAGVTNVNAATEYEIDQRFTSVASLDGQLFAIVNETDEMALYNKDAQNLAYDTYTNAVAGAAYLWKLHSLAGEADSVVQSCYSVEAVKADGSSINLWGNPAIFINSGAEGGFDGCFILGQGDKYGTDVKYGGVWEIEYLEGQGFALKNVARGGYFAGVNPAPTGTDPIYWTFCTLKVKESTDPLVEAKEALQTAIAIASNINPEGLADAIAAAQAALNDEDATVESLTQATQTLEAAVKAFEETNTETIYIEADLTAQFPVDWQGWNGATAFVGWAAPSVTTNDGRNTAACERYEGTCANTGDVFTRTLTGLTNGTYRIELYGAAAYTSGRGFDSELVEGDETAVYLYAETAAGQVKQYIPAHVATDFNGTGIATAVLDNVVITDGTVKLGMYKEMPYTNWHVVQIKGVTAKVDVTELHATALEAAQTALASEDYAVVTGEERTALETAVTNNTTVTEQTADAYEAAVEALSEATTTFTGAKGAYESLADVKMVNYAYADRFPYATEEKKAAAATAQEAEATSAADAMVKTEELYIACRQLADSHALLEGIENAVNITDSIVNPNAEEDIISPWTLVNGEDSYGYMQILSNEPLIDGESKTYRYFDGGDWAASAWDVALKQDIILPAGKYMLTVSARASSEVQLTVFAGEEECGIPSIGATDGLFGRGWNDASVEFELSEEGEVTIGVHGIAESIHNWMSFTRFRLMQFPAALEDIIAAAKVDLEAAITAAKAIETEGKNGAEALAIAIADAEIALNADEPTVETLAAAKEALIQSISEFNNANLETEPLFADGTYYIYNVGAGKYLGAGESWSTRAIVDNVGLDYYLSYNEGKYTIDSRVSNGYDSQYLNGEWNDGPMFGWTIKDKGNGYYMLSDGDQFLAAQEDGLVVMTNDSTLSYLWTLVTLDQRLAEMANASAENPVDATFLIQGANFNRNDQRNYAWSMEANNWTLSGGTNENRCAETYHTTFTLAQTLYNAPAGKYLVSAQGFYRQDGDMTEELPVFYANNSIAAFPVKDGAENSMSDASESFSAGLYTIEPFIVNVFEDGALTIGVRGTALNQWVIFDNFRLTYLGGGVGLEELEADYNNVLADARAALESENYAMITGIERTSLAETIEAYSSVENDQYAYVDAINNLSYATNYFTNVKEAYERLVNAKEQLAVCVENYPYAAPWYKEEASEYAELTAQMADEASEYADLIMSQARRIAESHALLEGVENSANMTGYISNADAYFGRDYWELVLNSGGYIDIRGDQPLTSADYGTYSYFDGGNWSSDYWDVALQQEINLPAGKYQLTVSSRASSDVAFTLFAGDASVAMPTIGAEGGLFGNGWNDTSLEFEMAEEGPVTIGVRGETNVIHNWMSFTRFRLAKFYNAGDVNKLYIADDTNLSKGNATLPISLQNEDEIVGLQFDVVLPYDMTLTEIASRFRTDSHSVSFNQMGDGSVRVVMASLNNEVIEGSDGVLLNLGVQVPAYMQMGWYGVTLKNVVMTTASLQTVKSADQTFYVNISGRMGDVNSDNVIDVTDVVLIIDNILEYYNADFNEAMADVNSDGFIDVTDVVNVIDAILGNIELSRGAEPIDRSAYTAFQMDLTIPAGYVLESVSLTEIAKNSHSLAYTMLPDGRCRVIVCSMNNEALPGAWDEVIRLNLRGKGDAQVNIDRAVFVTIDGERHELMMNPTSIAQISNLNTQTSNLYDLQGRRVEKSAKGVLIENGRKVVIK